MLPSSLWWVQSYRDALTIATERPQTIEALERIVRMGPQKTERFGGAFLAVLSAPDGD